MTGYYWVSPPSTGGGGGGPVTLAGQVTGPSGSTTVAVVGEAVVRTSLAALTADPSFAGRKIVDVADPTAPQGVATKAYVDSVAQGLDAKASVRAATTAAITLSGAQTIDGVALVAGDRVLVKDQAAAATNGLYVVAAGAWARSADADTSAEVTGGLFTFVTEGTVNGDNGFVLTTNDAIVLGTTALVFTQFSGAGQVIAGAGLTKTGNSLDVVANGDGSIVVNANDIQLGAIGEARWRAASAALAADPSLNGRKYTSAADGVAATDLATVGQVPALGSGTTLSIAGSGAMALPLSTSLVVLFGALTGDRALTLAAGVGKRMLVVNTATGFGLGTVQIFGSSSGSTYLAPGQSKLLWNDVSGILRGEDLALWRCELDISATTNNDVVVKTPPCFRLHPVISRTVVIPAFVSGPPTLRVGTTAGGTEVMASTPVAATLDAIIGHLAAHLGTAVDDGGSYYFATAQTLTIRNTVAGSTSAGSSRVRLQAEVFV